MPYLKEKKKILSTALVKEDVSPKWSLILFLIFFPPIIKKKKSQPKISNITYTLEICVCRVSSWILVTTFSVQIPNKVALL